jgi:hypothetical protein
MNLYSLRWTTARGWRWKFERECDPDKAEQWLEFFKKDCPSIDFILSEKEPKTIPKKDAPFVR